MDLDRADIRSLITKAELIHEPGYCPILLTPEGTAIHTVESYLRDPLKVSENMNIKTIDSFCDYYRYMAAESPVIKINLEKKQIKAIFDFHGNAKKPASCENTATFDAVFDASFREWHRNNKQWFTQKDFAEYLEDRCVDCSVPSPSEIMTLVTNFEQTTEVQFRSDIRLQDGSQNLIYNDENSSGKVQIPKAIELHLAIFEGEDMARIGARLKVRAKEGKLSFCYEIIDLQRILENAFNDIVEKMINEIEPPLVIR